MRPLIEQKIAELDLAPKVTLAGRQDAVERWFQAMDVFCLPSYANEGVPQAVVQAMLCGLPVVTTPVGSIVEAVTDQETALLVTPRETSALAAAIRRLLDDPALAERMGREARAQAEQKFGRDAMIARMEAVFQGVVNGHRARRKGLGARWERLRRSVLRRWKEWRLPQGYERLGTKYGGWWIDGSAIGANPLMIDCGLGLDISFPVAFLVRFGGTVIGIDPNPESLDYCRPRSPVGMQVWDKAFWKSAGESQTFFLPRSKETLPLGADGVSGSLVNSHAYVEGGVKLNVTTTSFDEVLARAGRNECDVLKLDIEGAEYEVLDDLCTRGLLGRVRQLLVEFHHRVTHHTTAETETVVARIQESGFRLVHVESRNYVFRRGDLG
jgi:FkbM family methyltransferase